MSEAKKVQLFERFASGFLHPLLVGGTVQIGRALPPALLSVFELARPSDQTDQETYAALHRGAGEFVFTRRVHYPDRGTVGIAMAGHNLALVTDPTLNRTFARGARKKIVDWTDDYLKLIGPPRSRSSALTRHVVLDRLLQLQRREFRLESWIHTYRFPGRPAPKWIAEGRTIGRAERREIDERVIDLWSQLDPKGEFALPARVRALVTRSPITEIMSVEIAPDFRFGAASLAVLSDTRLRSGIASRLSTGDIGRMAARFGAALLGLRDAASGLLAVALVFLSELLLIDTIHRKETADPLARPSGEAAMVFTAILPALVQADSSSSPLFGIVGADAQAIRHRAESLLPLVSGSTLALVSELVQRAFHPLIAGEARP